MISVFISYSRHDKAFTEYLGAELRSRSAEVFIDYQRLKAGNFVQQLGQEIENCDKFVLVISPRSVESPWVQAEVGWALSKQKIIVPLVLEDANLVNVFPVASLESVDFRRWSVDGNVSTAIRRLAQLLELPAESAVSETWL